MMELYFEITVLLGLPYYLKLWPVSYKFQVLFSGWGKVHCNKIKHSRLLSCHQLPSEFYINGVNSWQVIQTFSDLQKSCLLAKLKVAQMKHRAVLSSRYVQYNRLWKGLINPWLIIMV